MIPLADAFLCICCVWFVRTEISQVKNRRGRLSLYPFVWLSLAAILGVLAVQEVTGVLDLITDDARKDAIAGGWYGDRRPFQWLLIKTVPFIALSAGIAVLWTIRNAWRRYLLVVLSTLYWVSYAVIQGISFHNIDWLLRQHTAGLQNKTLGDLIGMVLTVAAILIAWGMDRRRGLSFDAGRVDLFVSQTPTQMGRISQLGWAAKRSLLAEGQTFADWYLRYRLHRRRRASRPKASGRRG